MPNLEIFALVPEIVRQVAELCEDNSKVYPCLTAKLLAKNIQQAGFPDGHPL